MPGISSLISIQLKGDIPQDLNLPPLRTLSASAELIETTFAPYLEQNATVTRITDFNDLGSTSGKQGICVLYIVGHAWIRRSEYQTSIRMRQESRVVSGAELTQHLLRSIPESSPLLLLVDTCNAEGLLAEIKAARQIASTCLITASSNDENTLEYPLDRSTRFAAAIRASLQKAPARIDAVELAVAVRGRLAQASIMPAQMSKYWVAGDAIELETVSKKPWRNSPRPNKTYLVLRSLLIASGVALAAIALWSFLYYRSHVLLTVDVPDFAAIADSAALEIDEQFPDRNQSAVLYQTPIREIGTLQLRVPAQDLVVVSKVKYKDGSEREIRFPLSLVPALNWAGKRLTVIFPNSEAIQAHPKMAYIPAVEWEQGPDRQKVKSEKAFWIDLFPVSVRQYRPFAIAAERKGEIQYSVLLDEERNAAAVRATGTERVPELMGDLNQVFNVINASQRAEGRKPGEAAGNTEIKTQVSAEVSCENCPAPLTMEEAQNFCSKHSKRIPTDLEWELAARGVDGRLYPWGNKFDSSKTNCVGLPDKGQPPASLQPSYKYVSGISPFGVIDMVGNAGDWVDTRGGYERTFMGGFYAFNPEECMTFKSLPDTGEPPWRKITVRCAQD